MIKMLFKHQALLALLLVSELSAQSNGPDSTTVIAGLNYHYGFIIAHSKDVVDISGSNPWGFTAEISRIRHTRKAWNTCNCISQNGISLSYFNLNNPAILGKSANLILFSEPHLVFGPVTVTLRAGAGLSYLTSVYDPIDNPQNLFFSRPVSGILLAQFSSKIRLSEHWKLRVGGLYNHISNGGTRQPNKGMNFPIVTAGLEFASNPLPFQKKSKTGPPDRSIHYYAGAFANTGAVDESGGDTQQRKPILGLQLGIYKPIANLHAFGSALEVVHDGTLKARALLDHDDYDHRIVSLLLRHHLLFGNFDFSQALGIYLFNQIPGRQDVFQRYALEHRLGQHLKIGFSLKAHLHVAEQMDVRITAIF